MNSALRKFSGPMALRIYGAQRRPICDGAPEGKRKCDYSSSSLSTAIKASVGS